MNHLDQFIQSDDGQALITQETLKISGAGTDLQYIGSLDERNNCSYPVTPSPDGYNGRDEIIGPGKGMIKVMEEETHEARNEAHGISNKTRV